MQALCLALIPIIHNSHFKPVTRAHMRTIAKTAALIIATALAGAIISSDISLWAVLLWLPLLSVTAVYLWLLYSRAVQSAMQACDHSCFVHARAVAMMALPVLLGGAFNQWQTIAALGNLFSSSTPSSCSPLSSFSQWFFSPSSSSSSSATSAGASSASSASSSFCGQFSVLSCASLVELLINTVLFIRMSQNADFMALENSINVSALSTNEVDITQRGDQLSNMRALLEVRDTERQRGTDTETQRYRETETESLHAKTRIDTLIRTQACRVDTHRERARADKDRRTHTRLFRDCQTDLMTPRCHITHTA